MRDISAKTYTIILAVVATAILLWILKIGPQYWDFDGQWIVSKCFLSGLNPYTHHTSAELLAHSLPPIPQGWGTSPWGLILGQIFYPGFLSNSLARYYFISLFAVTILIAALFLYKNNDHRVSTLFILLLSSISFLYPMQGGNAGSLMCLMLLLAWYLMDCNEYISGLLLAFAMIKPQLALLFCLYFLINRKYKLLAVAATMDIAAWAMSALILQTSMTQLLVDFFASGIGSGAQFSGILTLLSPFLHISMKNVMYLSMFLGVIYSLSYYKINRERGKFEEIAPFCVATAFWSYSWGNELLILLPVIVLAYQKYSEKGGLNSLRWATLAGYLSFGIVIIIAITKLMEIYNPLMSVNSLHIAMTLYLLGIVMGMCKYS